MYKSIKKKHEIFSALFEQWVRTLIWRERKIRLGNQNKDKTFYVIRRDFQVEGVFSAVNSILAGLKYAEKKHYIPVVDLKYCYSKVWQGKNEKWKENAWEYFFLQPAGYRLEDIKRSRNVILGQDCKQLEVLNFAKIHQSIFKIELWNSYYKKYIKLNRVTQQYVNVQRSRIFSDKRKVLGVFARLEVNLRPEYEEKHEQVKTKKAFLEIVPSFTGYPKQPSVLELIKTIEQKLEEWGYEYFFMCVDDRKSLEILKDHFGEKMLTIERPHKSLGDDKKKYATTQYIKKHNLGYLAEIYILSECDSILCGTSSGMAAAFVINGNKYKNKFVFGS